MPRGSEEVDEISVPATAIAACSACVRCQAGRTRISSRSAERPYACSSEAMNSVVRRSASVPGRRGPKETICLMGSRMGARILSARRDQAVQ